MRSFDLVCWPMGIPFCDRLNCVQTPYCRSSLVSKLDGKCLKAVTKILTLFLPTSSNNFVLLRRQDLREIPRFVVVIIEPPLRISTPGMLGFQKQAAGQGNVSSISDAKTFCSQPVATKSRDLPIPRNLKRITCDAVNPCIPDFLCDHRQVIAIWNGGVGYVSKAAGSNLRIRIPFV